MSFNILLSFVLMFSSVSVYAQGAPVSAANPSLQDQLNYIMIVAPKKANRSEFQQLTNYYYQKGTSFDTTQERDVEYLSVIGVEDVNKEFYPQVLSTVSESWKKGEAGAWIITQKIREVNLAGQVYKSVARKMVINVRGILTADEVLPGLSAVEDQVAFEKEISVWYSEIKQ